MLRNDCFRTIQLIIGTYLLPMFRYPIPRTKMDFFIPASRSRSSWQPAKCTQIFSKHAKKFRRQTQIFRTHATVFRTYTTFFRKYTNKFRRLIQIFRSHATMFRTYTSFPREHTQILRTNTNKMEHLLISAAASFPSCSPATTVLHGSGPQCP
jgi:hypothetical protein